MKGLHILTCSPLRTDAFPLPTSHSIFCVHFILLHPSPWMDHLLNHVWMRSLSSYCVTREKKNNQNGSSKWLWSSHRGFLRFAPYIFFYHFFSFNFVYFSWIIRVCLIIILGNAFRCFSIWTLRMLLIVIW